MGGSVEEVEKRRRKKEAWGESYVRFRFLDGERRGGGRVGG